MAEGFSPTADWSPDPEWPQAPPGWRFWIEDEVPRRRRDLWRTAGATAGVAVLTAGAAFAGMGLLDRRIEIRTLPSTVDISTATVAVPAPRWPSPMDLYADLDTWTRFGGGTAEFAAENHQVRLSADGGGNAPVGLVEPGEPRCTLRLSGRVRQIAPGGFTIGLASYDGGTLLGTGLRADFGTQAYRVVEYPGDTESTATSGEFDDEWHDVEVVIGPQLHSLTVDGVTVITTASTGRCGLATLAVWSGTTEFAGFSFDVE